MIFDYLTAAQQAGITKDKFERLCALVQHEFPSDELMAEPRILRAVLAIERGGTTLDQILGQEATKDTPREMEPQTHEVNRRAENGAGGS